MSIFRGEKISVEIFGESHSKKIGVNCTGFPKLKIDLEYLNKIMERRKPSKNAYSTSRKEPDEVNFTFGVNNGYIVDDYFSAEIENKNQRSGDYNNLYGKPRPSHADFTSFTKTGNLNFSGGGKFSGRMTAPLCIAGGIAKQYLEEKNIKIYSYVSQVGKVKGTSYLQTEITEEQILSKGENFALSNQVEMEEEIANAKINGDSVGAILECIVYNMPAGIGDGIFDGLESKIANLVYSIPAVKGIEFGSGFNLASMLGSQANDSLYYENGVVKTKTNNSGGINGGISNGMPITLRVAFRPTPSILKEQNTVDLVNKENTTIVIGGRHDSCVGIRAVPVLECAVALAILDETLK